jgi:predicted metal-dependent HD superfamily phosphohydrolase
LDAFSTVPEPTASPARDRPIVDTGPAPFGVRWEDLVGVDDRSTRVLSDLLAAWRRPRRAYHTLAHLEAVLDRLDELDPPGHGRRALDHSGGLTASGAARLAAWYHDAVYRPDASGNEDASAAMARRDLVALGWERRAAEEVARLVLLTVEHRSRPGDDAGAWLCDADLAVLGADRPDYAIYVAAVRAEYAHVDGPAWRTGRGAVLQSLLDRDQIYATVEGRRRWEVPARRNLTAELATLRP